MEKNEQKKMCMEVSANNAMSVRHNDLYVIVLFVDSKFRLLPILQSDIIISLFSKEKIEKESCM